MTENRIEDQIKKRFKTNVLFCEATGKSNNQRKNLKTTIASIYKKIAEINNWLDPLGLEYKLHLKKKKPVSK